MKQDGFQRTVKLQRIEREIGDAPSIGHVDRVFGKERPKGMLRKRRRGASKHGNGDTKKQKLVIMTWSLVFAAVVVGIVIVLMALRLHSSSREKIAGMPTSESPGNDLQEDSRLGGTGSGKGEISEDDKRVVSRFPSPSKDVALSLVKRAMLIRDPAQVEESFRVGSATPAEVAGFLKDMAVTDGPIKGYDWRSSMDANGLLLDGVLVTTKIGDKQRNRLALLTPDDKGTWRVDFEAFARTVTPSWNEILSGGAGKGIVRILFVKDNYYNGPFGDESQWTCFRLGSPDLNDDILGYCPTHSPQAAALELILANAPSRSKRKSPVRAVLEIQRTKGAEARQFEITRVLAEDWVRSADPFDQ